MKRIDFEKILKTEESKDKIKDEAIKKFFEFIIKEGVVSGTRRKVYKNFKKYLKTEIQNQKKLKDLIKSVLPTRVFFKNVKKYFKKNGCNVLRYDDRIIEYSTNDILNKKGKVKTILNFCYLLNLKREGDN